MFSHFPYMVKKKKTKKKQTWITKRKKSCLPHLAKPFWRQELPLVLGLVFNNFPSFFWENFWHGSLYTSTVAQTTGHPNPPTSQSFPRPLSLSYSNNTSIVIHLDLVGDLLCCPKNPLLYPKYTLGNSWPLQSGYGAPSLAWLRATQTVGPLVTLRVFPAFCY